VTLWARSSSRELPPRARRIRGGEFPFPRLDGTTSACAENTMFWKSARMCEWNYLRVRGEYFWRAITQTPEEELPPRARRILGSVAHAIDKFGTTSACAENTSENPRGREPYRNYLRVRGEYESAFLAEASTAELPPRARRIQFF